MKYTAIFEKGPTSWGAYVPDLPGCVAAGETLEETQQLIGEAVAFHIEGLREAGFAVPEPKSHFATIEAA
jgi:predicted RNase H-like HicB family nuclease